jgi:hypothetical protein
MRFGKSFISACFVLLAAAPAGAAVTSVYKCFDKNLGVVYTDQPCRGEHLAIETGTVNQAAVAELQREREAVARAAAERIADMRRLPERDYNSQFVYGGGPMGGYAGDTYYPAYGPLGYDQGYGNRGRDFRRPDFHRRSPPHVPAPRGDLIKR